MDFQHRQASLCDTSVCWKRQIHSVVGYVQRKAALEDCQESLTWARYGAARVDRYLLSCQDMGFRQVIEVTCLLVNNGRDALQETVCIHMLDTLPGYIASYTNRSK